MNSNGDCDVMDDFIGHLDVIETVILCHCARDQQQGTPDCQGDLTVQVSMRMAENVEICLYLAMRQ